MKLEITDVMIFEWDAETRTILISPAEGWKVNVNYPISEAHASMVTMEKMEGPHIIDLKSLTGMWVKCTTESDGVRLYKEGSWYQIGSDYWMESCWNIYSASEVFDLTDPRDYNPDERKPHQLQEYDAVECTPEERAEIIRIADECGVPMHNEGTENHDDYPNLCFYSGFVAGLSVRLTHDNGNYTFHSVPDFIAKIRGEYTEKKADPKESCVNAGGGIKSVYFYNFSTGEQIYPVPNKVNVTEHKHSDIV